MSLSLLVTISVSVFLSLVVVIYSVVNQRKITCMTGMMVAMSLGMLVGLLGGVIVGMIFSGNLFLSTIIGMGLGLVAGCLTGLPISTMAVLDGVLSGTMGGMMGAMLGEMIVPDYRDTMIKILFVFFIVTIFTLLYMLQNEVGNNKKTSISKKLLQSPVFMVLLIAGFFYWFNQLGPIISEVEDRHDNENIHQNHNQNEQSTSLFKERDRSKI